MYLGGKQEVIATEVWIVQPLSCVWLFMPPWTAACQASTSITNSQNLLKLISVESVMHPTISSSVIPFSSCLKSFPASGSFLISQFFTSGGQRIGPLSSASVLSVNIQDRCPLRLIGLISLQSKGLSRVFSNTTVQKHQFFGTQLSLWSNAHPYITTGKTIGMTRTFVDKIMSLLFNMLSRLVIALLPRSSEWVKVTQLCPTLCQPMDYPWNSLSQNTGVGSLSLL